MMQSIAPLNRWMEIGIGLYSELLLRKNSSNKFEINIVSKKRDRLGSRLVYRDDYDATEGARIVNFYREKIVQTNLK